MLNKAKYQNSKILVADYDTNGISLLAPPKKIGCCFRKRTGLKSAL